MAIHTARCASCLTELTIQVDVDLSDIQQLITEAKEEIMSALEDERAAIADLTTEVTDVLDALASQVQGGVSEADAEQLASDIRAQAQRLRDALPAPAPAGQPAPSEPLATDGAATVEPVPAPETPTV